MDREIKFRGKSLNTRTWVYGDLQHKGKRAFVEYEVAPETIGQFTGLLDKNGKEIYEGDVIQNKGVQIKVEWDNYQCGFNIKEYGIHLFETIGNIHDQSI